MKRVIALTSLLLLMLSYQNCAQRNVNQSDGGPTASGVIAEEIPAKGTEKMTIWDQGRQQVLDLDLVSGRMISYENYGDVRGASFCLNKSELSEVKTILENSSICEPAVNFEEMKNKVCTMLYKYPYVTLVKGLSEYRLGEMNNGCDIPVDLCGDKAEMLKNFITSVLKTLPAHACK